MNRFLIHLCLLLALCWTGCQAPAPYPSAMQQAERCMDTCPDSALILLQSMEDSIPLLPEETQMYHRLFTIQAKDKLYITHTDDSLINIIVTYYENTNNRAKLMLAYYYQGSVYRDLNDSPQALKAFQQAIDMNHPDYNLAAKIYSQMGYLFSYQGLYDEAIQVNRQSIKMYEKLNKRNKTSYALRDIARMYDAKEENDSALIYYKEALHTALADQDSSRYYGILGELGGQYYSWGMADTAKPILLATVCRNEIKNKSHIYTCLGDIYQDEMRWDSVSFYRNKAIECGDIYKIHSNYIGLYAMEKARKNPLLALKYLEEATILKDSIKQMTRTEAIAKIDALYNYQHTERENYALKQKQEKWMYRGIVLFFIVLCVFLATGSVLFYQKWRKEQTLHQEKERRRMAEEKYAQSQAAIRDNERKIAELDSLLEEAQADKDTLRRELLLTQQRILKHQNEEIIERQKEQQLCIATFKESELYKELWMASKNDDINLSPVSHPTKWIAIRENLDAIHSNFTSRLVNICPNLSETEQQICWLAKLGIGPSGAGRILKLSRQAITNARTRIMKKVPKDAETPTSFDLFINTL